MSTTGKKFDNGKKARWDCVPFDILDGLAQVMGYGAEKYDENPNDPNWRKVEDGYNRYFAALMRHLVADRSGENIDPESGFPHMWHAMFNVVCLTQFSKDKFDSKKTKSTGGKK